MDFVLKNTDVEAALLAHIKTLGLVTEGKHIALTYKTTRKPVTITVNVSVSDKAPAPVEAVKEVIKTTAAAETKPDEYLQGIQAKTEPAKLEAVVTAPTEADVLTETPEATPEPAEQAEAAPTNTNSLFG